MINDFLELEATDKEMADEILHFINSCEIRKGEFEGNSYVIEKLDQTNFIIYEELVDEKDIKSVFKVFSIYRKDFQNALISKAKECGYELNKAYLSE